MNIPIMHDDQHGTAIISTAALFNALEIAQKISLKLKWSLVALALVQLPVPT